MSERSTLNKTINVLIGGFAIIFLLSMAGCWWPLLYDSNPTVLSKLKVPSDSHQDIKHQIKLHAHEKRYKIFIRRRNLTPGGYSVTVLDEGFYLYATATDAEQFLIAVNKYKPAFLRPTNEEAKKFTRGFLDALQDIEGAKEISFEVTNRDPSPNQ